jgi:predicted acylesterase/phospholipase RssA
MADGKPEGKTVLVLSAGAPQSPLMAGALCAFVEHKKRFDIIYTSGAGALVGLLFAAPKDKSRDKALQGLVELGVSDLIYRFLPVNYKAFFKPGRLTQPIHRFAQHFKLNTFESTRVPKSRTAPSGRSESEQFKAKVDTAIDVIEEAIETSLGRAADRFIRLYNDLVDLWAAAITPIPPPGYWSKGLCAPLPFLEDLVDFDKLKRLGRSSDDKRRLEFYVNAFSPHKAREESEPQEGKSGIGIGMQLFSSEEIGPDQVRAAFAYPFIYPPVKIDGRLYFEGAELDPIGFGNLLRDVIRLINKKGELINRAEQLIVKERRPVTDDRMAGTAKTIVLIDVLASLSRYLLREPRNLWDAFGISIMMPVVAHAQNEVARFERLLNEAKEQQVQCPEFLKMSFDNIPEALGPHITEWSYSNMSQLFKIGREAGEKFLEVHGGKLPNA